MKLVSQTSILAIKFIIQSIIIAKLKYMDQNNTNPIPIISSIVNHLYQHQSIDSNVIDRLTSIQTYQISAYLGLTNLLYNRVLEVAKKGQLPHTKDETYYNEGKILQLRGQILKQYAKLLAPLLPQPAYSLARFDFQSFDKFCNDRGLQQLIRCSRGIYPCIDTYKTLPLQFLNFYQQVKDQGPIIVGNQSWQVARNLLQNTYFNEEQNVLKQQNGMDIQKNQEEQQLEIGKKLCYILLMGRKDQMQQYVKQLTDRIASQKQQDNEIKLKKRQILIDRFRFWYFNYNKFIEEGLQYYQSEGKVDNQLQLIYKLDPINFEEIIIFLLKKTIQTKIHNNIDSSINKQLQSKIRGPQFGDKFIWFLQYVKNDNYVPPHQSSESGWKFHNNNKFLFLAYAHTIQQLLDYGSQMQQSPLKFFKQMATYSNCEQQPYYRIFFSDQQLLDLYELGKLNDFPSRFMYQSELRPCILKSIFKNNQNKLANNLDKLNQLDTVERLKFIIASPLLAGIEKINAKIENKTSGQLILDYFDMNKSQFKNFLKDNQGKHVNQQEALKFYNLFINEWRQIYSFFRNFQLQYFQSLLNKYEQIKMALTKNQNKIEHQNINNGNNSESVTKADFQFPMSRPQICYYIIKKFVDILEKQKNYYMANKDSTRSNSKNRNEELTNSRNKLISFIRIMEKQTFRQFFDQLIVAAAQKIIKQQSMNSVFIQQFEDYVWSIYAQINLLIEELYRKLINVGDEGQNRKTQLLQHTSIINSRNSQNKKVYQTHIDKNYNNQSNMEEENE